ncbi:winged helix-turn-helix transcriptional regulator [Streptomyces sp. Vc17.3-30]|nr:winged helix-turn-helix transcriptional regulator [Streptomyces sp. Vc17.3-30]
MDGAGPRALGAAAGAGTARKPVGNRPSGSDAEAADQPLVADGLLERRPYRAGPVRHQYVLTEGGRSLRPVIVALVDFTTGAKAVPKKAQVRGAVSRMPRRTVIASFSTLSPGRSASCRSLRARP